jgi:hypothetical protein
MREAQETPSCLLLSIGIGDFEHLTLLSTKENPTADKFEMSSCFYSVGGLSELSSFFASSETPMEASIFALGFAYGSNSD